MLEGLTRDLRYSPMSELGPTTWRAAELIEQQQAEIERLRAAGDALAKQITKPCRCVEAHDGAINETCAPCAACFDWEEARRG